MDTDLHSGDTFQVSLSYDGTNLTETIADTQSGKSATETYATNLPAIIGSSTAYVGFTASTGVSTATQSILNWTYVPTAAVSPNAPTGLGASPASATSIFLTWTANAQNQTGYALDRATDAAFTQNLITESLPASPASFTDVATGLSPGGTYYYRLRAVNAAGDSGYTNVASVFIPVAPPTPTNQVITNITPTEIDMSWQDNAGNQAAGYRILRAVNNGSFVTIATLPPTSRPAPSTYSWNDTGLLPGAHYEYHITAYNVSGSNDFAGLNANTLALAPSGVTAASSSGAINLSWKSDRGAVTYNVYRGTASGGEAVKPIATGITTTQWNDSTATPGVKYFYKVTAVNINTTYTPPLPSESQII